VLADRGDGPAAHIIADWSRVAVAAVLVMLASAGLLVWYLKGDGPIDIGWWYDQAVLTKIGIVAVGLALALVNKQRLTPALLRGEPGAGRRLARAVRTEFVILLAVFFAASELVSVHPNPPKPVEAAQVEGSAD
jgi:putative copper export protein